MFLQEIELRVHGVIADMTLCQKGKHTMPTQAGGGRLSLTEHIRCNESCTNDDAANDLTQARVERR